MCNRQGKCLGGTFSSFNFLYTKCVHVIAIKLHIIKECINQFTSTLAVTVVFDPVEYTVSEDAGSQLYQLRLLGEIETQVVVTVTSEDGTAEGITPCIAYLVNNCVHKLLIITLIDSSLWYMFTHT